MAWKYLVVSWFITYITTTTTSNDVLVSSEIFNFQLHQARSISLTYSFAYSLTRTQGENIWEECNRTFDRLPLSAVIDHEIFCIHGGTYVDVDSVYTPIDETWKYQKTKHFCVNSTYISIIAAT